VNAFYQLSAAPSPITDKILKELPTIGIRYITLQFSAVPAQRVLSGAMESSTGHPHLEARKSS
jgi:hypothetical protein